MQHTRRQLMAAAATAVGAGTLAGCTDNNAATASPSGTTAAASFFVFSDISSHVAGDAATADLLVPVGQHGHGWEPGPRVRESIRAADLLVHGMTGFQPWVDDILTDLDADGADVSSVDVSAAVDLLAVGAADGDHSAEPDGDHADSHTDHTDSHDEPGEPTHADGHNSTHAETDHADGHDNHSAPDSESRDDHDHGTAMDPHFWMDPRRVQTATDTIRQALAAVDPDNADAYADNAASLQADLASLDEQIETTIADAATDVLLVAGHNAFRYLGDRYDVTIEALTNVSPDDRPTTRDIERAQSLIDTHDLRYICADPLESQRAADQLVADTDAEAVLPLTAIPGRTDEWAQNDHGYIEIMETVNLPTLERALDA